MADHTAVFGIFETAAKADKAVGRLTSAGFSNADISLLSSVIDGLLAGMGIPEHKAGRYEGWLQEGGMLLSVECCNALEVDRANTILQQNGAADISSTSVQRSDFHGAYGR